jgi:MSHA biogenesis protein MshK
MKPQIFLLGLCAAATMVLAPDAVVAQVTSDPTRPPAALLSTTPGGDAQGGSLLQSVMITPTERSAIIGGESVKQGGKYGDARVVKITETEVVLRSSTGTETLHLYPGVEMKPVVTAPPAGNKRIAKKKRGSATKSLGIQR